MTSTAISVSLHDPIATINPNLYGHFAEHLGGCIYGGIWVGEESTIPNIGGIRQDVVEALRRIDPPALRWPGGCFADDYHWQDGIGPRQERPRRVNIWWGEDIETNQFGTHEFVRLCELIGAKPYLAGNLGSGTPAEMRNWLEYCNFAGESSLAQQRAANGSPAPFAVRYWGVGNENWGCGGNMDPEDYAVDYKRFSTFLRDLSDTPLALVACGPNGNKVDWTRRFFTKLGDYRRIHGFAAHYYTRGRGGIATGTATTYSDDEWYTLIWLGLKMEALICQQRATLDSFDPERRIGLIVDEWGTWHPPTPGRHPRHLWQQNTLRDALVAATTLDIFNRHADKVVMGNIAQTVNVLQAMVLTDGARMLTTPTYHVYDLYKAHQGGQSLPTHFETETVAFESGRGEEDLPILSGSASRQDDVLTLSVVNAHVTSPVEATIHLRGGACRETSVTCLRAADIHAHNTFEDPDQVRPEAVTLDWAGDQLAHTFPPASVTVLRMALA